ncbi:iron-containing alcohol dehydrogenase family protein [Ramlibacter sp. 2FC]|uniref:iron-containing alcohol dehydrogenase family protein n=1 Tax=Ramlibacter sp. 2FC TaxID=2502188 RepID=UPI0010F4867F|nr:iron-containing alcohol dehydrogenase family protein [Ramlibacter sp. 2FC]
MTKTDSLSYQHISAELRVFHGIDSLVSLKRELERNGCRRAVVVCGRTISRSEELGLLREALGPLLAGVTPTAREHSPVSGVEETAQFLKDVQADAVIAVGGGSAAVTARAAAVLVGEGKPLSELCTRRLPDGKFESPRLNVPKLPQFVVPTTPSTAFVKAGTAVHDDSGQRLAMFDPRTRAKAIFVHPAFVGTAPTRLARDAGLNALANAVEALESPKCDPISEAFLLQALRLIRQNLPTLADGATRERERLVVAAILCGRGTEQGGAGLASVLAHAIGHRTHVANGVVNAIVLPHTMRYNAPVTGSRRSTLLEALGAPDAPSEPSDVLAAFLKTLDTPKSLREIGLPQEGLIEIAEAAMLDWFISRSPRPVPDVGALLGILEPSW